MNELQKVEFDLLCEAVKIFSDLKLTYYLVCGSALGAIKYGGFIPWDDDMDIALPRDDYEIFIKEAGCRLPDGLFLQNHHTEASFPQIFSKLRNSRTTYIEKSISALPINHGVYIDIFPLDEYPADRGAQRRLEFEKQRLFLKLSVVYCSKKTGRAALYQHLNRLFHYDRHVHENVERLERVLTCAPTFFATTAIGREVLNMLRANSMVTEHGRILKASEFVSRKNMMITLLKNTATGVPIFLRKSRWDIIMPRL